MSKNTVTILKPETLIAEPSAEFNHARKIQRAVKMNMVQAAGFMVLFGLELKRLKKIQPETRGAKGKNPTQIGFLSWEQKVKQELGIGDDTARKYIEMADEAKKRVNILSEMEEVLLTTSLMALPEAKQEEIVGAVQKLTDGSTAKSLMQEWGIARKDPSSNLHADRNKGGNSTKKKLTPEQEAQERFEALLKLMTGTRLDGGVIEWAKLLNHLPLEHTPDMPDGHVSLVEYREELTHWLEAIEIAIKRQAKAQHKTFTKLKSSEEHSDILDS